MNTVANSDLKDFPPMMVKRRKLLNSYLDKADNACRDTAL